MAGDHAFSTAGSNGLVSIKLHFFIDRHPLQIAVLLACTDIIFWRDLAAVRPKDDWTSPVIVASGKPPLSGYVNAWREHCDACRTIKEQAGHQTRLWELEKSAADIVIEQGRWLTSHYVIQRASPIGNRCHGGRGIQWITACMILQMQIAARQHLGY
jgi:hypothetical protein